MSSRTQNLFAHVPPRAWIATVYLANGGSITTTIRGMNPAEAERAALADIKNAVRAVARQEVRGHV